MVQAHTHKHGNKHNYIAIKATRHCYFYLSHNSNYPLTICLAYRKNIVKCFNNIIKLEDTSPQITQHTHEKFQVVICTPKRLKKFLLNRKTWNVIVTTPDCKHNLFCF